ncbi:rhodanese-like domain-containing protein [Halonotius terrestris]|uniref:Rhodanese-like domain-containing protein n=1 Tax=Halonotius terrestris TaxID=2487750 RepID=A0A8J8P788_9EURY|nr:rhodanese-like domain-containing protein [Halonotius terrestris]TQQ80905.1 rhodanese-like domain-containing protein [Halonotius terrestris]
MDGEISPAAVEDLLDGDDARIVDIRSPTAYEQGHIPDSENIPFETLPDRVAELADADRIITVCPHGQASVQAARLIGSYEGTADSRVESMDGGLTAWDGPLESETQQALDEGPEAPF